MIAWGHAPETVWNYTPKQAEAWAMLGYARHRAEAGESLMITAMGAQGKGDKINEQVREWNDG